MPGGKKGVVQRMTVMAPVDIEVDEQGRTTASVQKSRLRAVAGDVVDGFGVDDENPNEVNDFAEDLEDPDNYDGDDWDEPLDGEEEEDFDGQDEDLDETDGDEDSDLLDGEEDDDDLDEDLDDYDDDLDEDDDLDGPDEDDLDDDDDN